MRIDEDLGIGQPCDPPGPVCGPGVFECNGAMMPVCNTGPGGTMSQAQTELCNGQNDDCDGATDEGFDVGTSCDPVGECGIGTIERPNDPGAGLTFGCVNGAGGNNAGNAITDARIGLASGSTHLRHPRGVLRRASRVVIPTSGPGAAS